MGDESLQSWIGREEVTDDVFLVEAWSSTVILGADEAAGHVFISFPTELLEGHRHEMQFEVNIEVDRIEHTLSPTTGWTATLGDLLEPAFAFDTELVHLEPVQDPEGRGTVSFHEPWQHIFFQIFDPISIQTDPAACDVGACLPCDGSNLRCEVALTVARDSVVLPRVRIDIVGSLARDTTETQ